MKTAGRENPNRWPRAPRNRAHGAAGQNRSRSIKWAAKQEKFQPQEICFFLTSNFIERFSINGIAGLLNERRISTRTGKTRWERSVVWAMLRNPAYEGKACYGKTEQSERQRITRPLRQRNSSSNRTNCHRQRPRADWLGVCAPALVSKEAFALAQEQ